MKVYVSVIWSYEQRKERLKDFINDVPSFIEKCDKCIASTQYLTLISEKTDRNAAKAVNRSVFSHQIFRLL